MEVGRATAFGVSIERESNQRIHLAVHGGIDSLTVMDFDFHLNDALNRGAVWILVDLSSVDHVSSVGVMRLQIARNQALNAGGDLVVLGAKPQVMEVFQHLAVDVQMIFVATKEEAWAVLGN